MTEPSPTSRPMPKRRWLRYSLSTLFVLVSTVCVLLAFVVVPSERQKRAVAALRATDGAVLYDFEEAGENSPKPEWVARLLGIDYVASVRCVWLTAPTEEEVQHASHLTTLRVLQLRDAFVDDADLSLFAGHFEMRELYLENTKVTDGGLAHLANMRHLEILWLSNTEVGDAGLAYIRTLTNLRTLGMDNTRISDRGMMYLAELPNLRTLSVAGTRVGDAGAEQLGGCKNLTELDVTGTDVTSAAVSRLHKMLPGVFVSTR